MSKCDDGGTAFPFPTTSETATAGPWAASPGMTLRDYFAAKAMQAIISTSRHSSDGLGGGDMLSGEYINPGGEPVNQHGDKSHFDVSMRWVPSAAYMIADAMLKARNKRSDK